MQRIDNCPQHADCTLISDGSWVYEAEHGFVFNGLGWVSHLSAEVPAEVRLNLDYPEAEDHRA